jgi:nucleoside-diphosphate-sugar epimerase
MTAHRSVGARHRGAIAPSRRYAAGGVMKVFVTGASGYIGFRVACALRRAGHEVYGLVRSDDNAARLRRHEIYPVLGSLQKLEGCKALAAQCAVLVHCAIDYQADTFMLDRTTIEALIGYGEFGAQPKTVIYTSGVWVYGETRGRLVDETSPLAPPKLVARRAATEALVIEAKHVRGIVIRPGVVYGHQGGLTAPWFAAAVRGGPGSPLEVVGDGRQHWAMVHVDDLAELYVRAAESGLRGEIFNAVDRSRASVRELAEAAARAAGHRGEIRYVPPAEAAKTLGELAECLALDQWVDGRKAERLLGWRPRHAGFVEEAALYFESWKAAQA